MKQRSKLSSEEQQQQSAEQEARQQTSQDFATVEEVLRHDAAGIEVPPGIAQKLRKIPDRNPGTKPWWKNLLGG